jgi:hypothetical protein
MAEAEKKEDEKGRAANRAAEICARQERLETNRQPWIKLWEEIAELVDPKYVNTFRSWSNDWRTQGQLNSEKQFDPTAALSRDRGTAAVHQMLTPDSQKWHRYRSLDAAQNASNSNLRYFDATRDAVFKYRYAPKANFVSQITEVWSNLLTFGTACLFVDRLEGGGLRYRCLHLGEFFFQENHQGLVDTVHRRFKLTARQAVQKFGDKCPEKIAEYARDEKKKDDMFWFIHCVEPRSDLDVNRMDYKGMKYASWYVSVEGKEMIDEGGYRTMPYIVFRYSTTAGEDYGRCPVMAVMPSIRVLNEEKKTVIKAGHRAVDPVLLAHDDGVVGTINLRPGYVNYGAVDAQGRKLVHTLDTGNLNIGKELMDDERIMIKDALFVTIFQILTETPQMTATEVLERVREKGILLSPLGRQHEGLSQMNERELDLLDNQGKLPEMPKELADVGGWEAQVVYDNPLTRAMMAEEITGFMRSMEMAIQHATATQDPSALDWFEIDTAMPEIMDGQAVPARWVATLDAVMAKREGRKQQTESQQLIDAAPGIASVIKSTGGVQGTGL